MVYVNSFIKDYTFTFSLSALGCLCAYLYVCYLLFVRDTMKTELTLKRKRGIFQKSAVSHHLSSTLLIPSDWLLIEDLD